ncbi:MAG: NADH-quinone oxidoreductase subunit NuoK, partial [Planctomycetales bacterium]|nr:NADH-quinone oxidoreductase subunit NuoK [Planctomycetales bacterium]
LIAIGLTGFLVRRNLIVMFLCAEMMLQGVSLSLVAWGRFHANWSGQLLVVFIITVAACEAAIALVLVLMLCRRAGNLDSVSWQSVREAGTPVFVDTQLPEEGVEAEHWPTLTPAGMEPNTEPQEQWYRTHV